MTNIEKFWIALNTLRPNTECTVIGEVLTESDFNTIEWKMGDDENEMAIVTTTCPHSEITWNALKAEMDKL
jgi:hypothetical protein